MLKDGINISLRVRLKRSPGVFLLLYNYYNILAFMLCRSNVFAAYSVLLSRFRLPNTSDYVYIWGSKTISGKCLSLIIAN